MVRIRLGLGLGVLLATGLGIVACGDDGPETENHDTPPDAAVEAARQETGAGEQDSGGQDTGLKDGASDARDADADAATLPGVVNDLAGVAETHVSVKLTWTAPPDYTGAGTVGYYDIRYATTPITNETEFLAATALATPPIPGAPGTAETVNIDGLTAETIYYVALRAQYDNDAYGPLSNVATVTTKARATFLISEIAPLNNAAAGGDFIELVATKAGSAAGLEVRKQFNVPLVFLGPLDVAVGDRVVIHLSGLPGPAGFAQEDTTKNKASSTEPNASANAYDVYSAETDIIGFASVAVIDGETYQDGVAYSDRSLVMPPPPDEWGLPVLGFYNLANANQWTFSTAPETWPDLPVEEFCQFMNDAVNASGDTTPDCGGPPATLASGRSIQRKGVVDTNTPADFTVGPQTRGEPNVN